MSTGISQSVLERIKKLHAKAVSLQEMGPNSEAEAQLFMGAVQQMLDKYNLELSEVDYQLGLQQQPVKMHRVLPEQFGRKPSKTRSLWQIIIAHALCELYNCSYLQDGNLGNSFWIIGRREHREVAEFMCTVILRLAEELSYKAYVKHYYACQDQGDVTMARGYKQGFLTGFAERIIIRCKELERARTQESRGVALMRLSQEKALIKQFREKLEQGGVIGQGGPIPKGRAMSMNGIVDGQKAGNQVNLQANALPKAKPQAPTPKKLGSGTTA